MTGAVSGGGSASPGQPGGSSSVTPGADKEGGARASSGMAGVSGGPTATPAGETAAKR